MRSRSLASILGGLLCDAMVTLGTIGALATTGIAAAAETAPPLVAPERQGYAFEYPRILAEQRLFGVAHGVALLTEACRTLPQTAEATNNAYAAWYGQQQAQITAIKDELAFYYYGSRAAEADWQNIVGALKLRTELGLAPDSEQLAAACATLPQALQQARYDLAAQFELAAVLAASAHATRVEALSAACTAQLSASEQQTLATRLAEWHAREDATIAATHAQMLHDWAQTKTSGAPGTWLQAQRQRYSNPPEQTCATLADWLQTPAASLAQSFAMPPLPVSAATSLIATTSATSELGTPAATAAAAARPLPPAEQTPCPVSDAAIVEIAHDSVETQDAPNLFELLMKALNEHAQAANVTDAHDAE